MHMVAQENIHCLRTALYMVSDEFPYIRPAYHSQSVCLFAWLSLSLFVCSIAYVYRLLASAVSLSILRFLCQFILPDCLSVRICLSTPLYVCFSICMFVCLPAWFSKCLPVYPAVCLSLGVTFSVPGFEFLSVCLSVDLSHIVVRLFVLRVQVFSVSPEK